MQDPLRDSDPPLPLPRKIPNPLDNWLAYVSSPPIPTLPAGSEALGSQEDISHGARRTAVRGSLGLQFSDKDTPSGRGRTGFWSLLSLREQGSEPVSFFPKLSSSLAAVMLPLACSLSGPTASVLLTAKWSSFHRRHGGDSSPHPSAVILNEGATAY